MTGGTTSPATDDALASLAAFEARLAALAPSRRSEVLRVIVLHLRQAVGVLRPTRDELRALIDFLTETGHYADARRQEWVLLADALGLSSAVEAINCDRPAGATPNTFPGPFYRSDAPAIEAGQSISRDGRGEPMLVSGVVTSLDGAPLPCASIEIWQANGDGLYENQEPDHQPEHNLRGRLTGDASGRFQFLSIKPAGYSLPSDGPVGQMLRRLDLPLQRPAHINLKVSAPGHETLVTHIFDQDDPAIDADPIFGVKPALLAEFRALPSTDSRAAHELNLTLVLCPSGGAHPMPGRSSQ